MGMFGNLFGSSASATGGLFSAAGGAIFGNKASKANKRDAQFFTDQTKWNPGNLSAGGYNVSWDGGSPTASLSPQLQGIQNNLYGLGGSFLGNLGSMGGSGGVSPDMMNAFAQYNMSAPGAGYINPGQQYGISTGMGDQFNQTSQGFLGGLGSFDPNQAAADYTQNLRDQSKQTNFNQANNLAQSLFNTGRLGSSGGADLMGQLVQAQNQQDLQFQQAGRDYAGQEQSRLAGLASGFGQLGTGINQSYAQSNNQFANDYFNRSLGAQQSYFNQGNQRAQQRFQNAMDMFGMGNQNLQTQYGIGSGLLGMGGGIDNNLLNAINSSANIEATRSGVNQAAYNPLLQASIARNNQKLAGYMNGIGAINNFATTTSQGLGDMFDMYMGGMGGGGGGGMMGGFGF